MVRKTDKPRKFVVDCLGIVTTLLMWFTATIIVKSYRPITPKSCDWVCKIDDIHASNVYAALSKTGQMKIEVRVHKRVEQACANFTSIENSSSFIEVWISTPASDDRIQPREFSLLSFVIIYFLENLPPFRYFHGKYTEHEVVKISTEISCIFRPTSNESNRFRANGLDELYSPYFYIRELANFSQNKPFLSPIWTEDSVYVSVGFTNPDKKSQTSTENSEYMLQLERLQYNVLLILGHLAWLYLTFYSASFLMLFRTNIATVEIAETVTCAIDRDGEEDTEPGDNSSPESCVVNILSSAKSDGTGGGALDVERAIDAGGLNHRAANRSSSDNTASEPDTIEQDIRQSGAHNRDKKNFKSVRVIHVGEAPSSVGLRSLIANYLLRNRWVKLFFLLVSPLLPVMLLDLFLLPPRLFSRIAPILPSTSITKSVFHFIYEKSPVLLVFLVFFFIRCLGLCFFQSSANRVPSFLFRKHIWCFILNCYITQLMFPNNHFSACKECEESTSDCPNECEFPMNIKDKSLLQIILKDWKDVFHHLFPKYCRRFFPEDENTSPCSDRCSRFCLLLSRAGFFVFYIILCVLDFLLSCHIITVCYDRVWLTADHYEGKRYKQFLCLCIEFLLICSSIIWVVYFLSCCSAALEIAFASLLITCFKYPLQTILGWAIYITYCHKSVLSHYSSFTDKYDNLELIVFKVCVEHHAKEIDQYQKGDVTNIPEDLFVSARKKFLPLEDSVWELIQASLWWVGVYLIVLIIISSLEKPYNLVLSAIVTLLNVLHPWLQDLLYNCGKKQEQKVKVLKTNVKQHVDKYFKEKLD